VSADRKQNQDEDADIETETETDSETDTDTGDTVLAEVPTLMAGMRVDRGVSMLANVSRSTAAELVSAGRVLIDGAPAVSGKDVLREGAQVTVHVRPPGDDTVAAESGITFEVVHADPDVAVVDKPAGLVVHPGAGHSEGTLVGGLLDRFPDLAQLVADGICPPDRPGIVHRLDKGTSGLLAVARTAGAYEALVDQLATRTMERHYLALVEGVVADDRGEVEAPIGRSARTPTKMAVTAAGKPARTAYSVRERRPATTTSAATTLLELALQSGRTHQIRVHMAAIGHPVVGDARYGNADKRLGPGRFFLHAFRLAFIHPTTGERLEFTSPLPDDLEQYLAG
jgi:23S rRNA pseudouridine1911/1915/1917 synthase